MPPSSIAKAVPNDCSSVVPAELATETNKNSEFTFFCFSVQFREGLVRALVFNDISICYLFHFVFFVKVRLSTHSMMKTKKFRIY